MLTHEPNPHTPMGRMALRAKRVPVAIRAPLLFVSFAVAAASIILDVGPYQVIADAQGALFDGEHYLAISALLTLLVCVMPAGIFIQLIARYFPDVTAGKQDPYNASPFGQGAFPPGPSPYHHGPYFQGPSQPGQPPHGQGPAQPPPQGYYPPGPPRA